MPIKLFEGDIEMINMREGTMGLFSINTLLTDTHSCQAYVKCACCGLEFHVHKIVPVFFSSAHRRHLIQFSSAGTQTRRHHRHHLPRLDILEPPESDVLIFPCWGGWGRREVLWAHGLFSPFLSVYLFTSFHLSSIR